MAIALAMLGIICVLYGLFIMALGSGTWFFAFWYALGAILLVVALSVHHGWWESLSTTAQRVIGVAAAVLLGGFLVTQAFILSGFNDHGEDGLDCLIVLGAQVRDGGPSPVLTYRLETACDYLAENPETRCIVSGGQGQNEPAAEADVMAAYLIERGIDPDRIIIENRSSNTKENVEFSAALLDPARDRVGVVTNDFHVFRGTALARKAGYAHVTGIAAPSNLDILPNNLVRESLSLAKDFLAGNL